MNLKHDGDSEARFAAYVEGLASVIGHVDRTGPLRDYCTGLMLPGERKSVEPMAAGTAPARAAAGLLRRFVVPGGAQERRADGGEDRAGTDGGAAPVAAAFCRYRAMVGREGAGQSARDGAAGDREGWADRGVDYRRHVVPKERQAFGRRAPSVLRAAWQAGQLPGDGVVVDRQPLHQPSGRLSAVSAEGLGRRYRASEQGRRAFGHRVQDQTGDRARTDTMGL